MGRWVQQPMGIQNLKARLFDADIIVAVPVEVDRDRRDADLLIIEPDDRC